MVKSINFLAFAAVIFLSPLIPALSYSPLGTWDISSTEAIGSISQRGIGGGNLMGLENHWDETDPMILKKRQQQRGTRRPVGNQSLYRNFRSGGKVPGNTPCAGNKNVCTSSAKPSGTSGSTPPRPS